MIHSDQILLTSVLVLTILISATFINYTSKFVFISPKLKKPANQIYDLDQTLNITSICIFSENSYTATYEESPCFNKTLVQWYNPWFRHYLWKELWNKIKTRNQLERLKLLQEKADNGTYDSAKSESVPETDLPCKKEKRTEKVKEKEKPVEFVYSILVGLLLLSGIVSCWEVCKVKLKRNEGAAGKAQDRQCSLADFTMNRHLRRESQQQAASYLPKQGSLELTTKVTQNLIHQSSLDRAFPKMISEALKAQDSRRKSVPLYPSSDFTAGQYTGTPSSPKLAVKRQSVDTYGEDVRKKPKHFIRRH